MDIINKAIAKGQTTLSEFDAKKLLTSYGIPVTREMLVTDVEGLVRAAAEIGYPIAVKGCSPGFFHKTEKKLVHLNLTTDVEARAAFIDLTDRMNESQSTVVVQEMIVGQRELVIGMSRDPQFGPSVMFGLGGIFAETLEDVSFRVAPLTKRDAREMMREIKGHKIFGEIRGLPSADLTMLAEILVAVGNIALEKPVIKEIDINPVILSGSNPIVVDALMVLDPSQT